MTYSRLAVTVLNMASPGSEAIMPSAMQISGDQQQQPVKTEPGRDRDSAKRQNGVPASSSSSSSNHKKGVTFADQDSLPKLPIPDLESTCRKYLESLAPLQTVREHQETKAAVRHFLKSDGPELQERLKKYASSKTSYIEQFCKFFVVVVLACPCDT